MMSQSLRIGVADDDAGYRAVIKEMLSSLGHTVVGLAENGEQLVEQCRSVRPDVLLIDLEMPVLDGLATAEEINADERIPIILVSGHSDFSEVVRHHEPIAAFLAKPVTLESLNRALREAMARVSP
jgi:CheY-like chemotaxis protein